MITLPFIDAHFHPLQMAYFRNAVDLEGVQNKDELKRKLEDVDDPIVGFHFVEFPGFSGDVLTNLFPSRPAIIIRTCLHKLWMNDSAIEKFGQGLEIAEDGSVVEDGVWTVIDRVYNHYGDVKRKLVRDLFVYLLFLGIAGGVEMGVSPEEGRFMAETAAEVGFEYFYFVKSQYDPLDCMGDSRCLGLKLFADGSLGARTAALKEPYSDDPLATGILNMSDEEMYKKVKVWHEAGYDVAVHVIGDRALSQVIRIFRDVLKDSPRPHRHRVEHLQVMYPGAIHDIYALGLISSIQPTFSIEIPWALQRVGRERMHVSYRWRELIEGGNVLIGTDAPVYGVKPYDVINGLTDASFWRDINLEPSSVSLGKAIDLYTEGNMRYLGLITSPDLYRVEWKVFPYEVSKVISGGRVVYEG